jgi:hypothetical protein
MKQQSVNKVRYMHRLSTTKTTSRRVQADVVVLETAVAEEVAVSLVHLQVPTSDRISSEDSLKTSWCGALRSIACQRRRSVVLNVCVAMRLWTYFDLGCASTSSNQVRIMLSKCSCSSRRHRDSVLTLPLSTHSGIGKG